MKKFFSLVLAVAVCFSLFAYTGGAQASARTASWVVSVTYQNVGNAATNVNVDFYQEGSATPISFDPLAGQQLAQNAGRSFFIGSVTDLTDGFRGNAVMSASQPLVATVVQFSQDAGFKMRMLYNGFKVDDGSNQYLVATSLANTFSRTTIFSIQNIENEEVKATVNFYDTTGALSGTPKTHTIPANSSKYIEMDDTTTTGLSSTFNGSAVVTAVKTAGGNANVVVAVSELFTNSNVGANFEGVPLSRAANTIYLATALCQRFGLDTFFAVQNASLTPGDNASITVTYYNTDGSEKTSDGPYSLGPGQKKSITTCSPNGVGMGTFTGSARIVSTGAKIVAVGKAQNSLSAGSPGTQDVFTIFNGEAVGATRLAFAFIRYANNTDYSNPGNTGGSQRAFLAIQNLSPSSAANITVRYLDKNGAEVGSTTYNSVAPFAKVNSDASSVGALGKNGMKAGAFGYYTDGSFGGAVIVESTQPVIAIVRVQHPGAGEDYNGVAAPAP